MAFVIPASYTRTGIYSQVISIDSQIIPKSWLSWYQMTDNNHPMDILDVGILWIYHQSLTYCRRRIPCQPENPGIFLDKLICLQFATWAGFSGNVRVRLLSLLSYWGYPPALTFAGGNYSVLQAISSELPRKVIRAAAQRLRQPCVAIQNIKAPQWCYITLPHLSHLSQRVMY